MELGDIDGYNLVDTPFSNPVMSLLALLTAAKSCRRLGDGG